jgi:hypothetical protein
MNFGSLEHDLFGKSHEHSLTLLEQRPPLRLETARINERQPPGIFITAQALYFPLSPWRSGQSYRAQSWSQSTICFDGF